MNREESYLLDVYNYAQEAKQMSEGMDIEDFKLDKQAQYAVLYAITIIGEAVKRLSAEFRAKHSEIAWKQVAGMRDKLIHDYRETDISLVWAALHSDIPELIDYIEPLLRKQ